MSKQRSPKKSPAAKKETSKCDAETFSDVRRTVSRRSFLTVVLIKEDLI